MKKKFTVSAVSAGGGASLGVHSARIAGNERIAAGRLARCRSIVAANTTLAAGWATLAKVPIAGRPRTSRGKHGTCSQQLVSQRAVRAGRGSRLRHAPGSPLTAGVQDGRRPPPRPPPRADSGVHYEANHRAIRGSVL